MYVYIGVYILVCVCVCTYIYIHVYIYRHAALEGKIHGVASDADRLKDLRGLQQRVASVFVLLYQQLRQYLYSCTSQPGTR